MTHVGQKISGRAGGRLSAILLVAQRSFGGPSRRDVVVSSNKPAIFCRDRSDFQNRSIGPLPLVNSLPAPVNIVNEAGVLSLAREFPLAALIFQYFMRMRMGHGELAW